MIGVILAAGMAKRLRPLTDTQPKCLLTVGSRTLLQRTVEAMASTGITEFVVVTGYRAEMIRSFLSSLPFKGTPLHFHFLHNALALNRHELGEEEMKIVVDAHNRITEISKTCRIEEAAGESVGIEKMTSDYSEALFRELDQMIEQEGLVDIFYERAFERLIPQGFTFKVIDTTHYFSYELDTPEDFQRATELLPKELV